MLFSIRQRRWHSSQQNVYTTLATVLLMRTSRIDALHHMKILPPQYELNSRATANTPLIVTNQCGETIYPAILTQSGTGPGTGGFELTSGSNMSMAVSADWQGRVWGRSNCTFSAGSSQCGSGDCGGQLSCTGTGQVPTTLAEFTLNAGDGHTYYDLSLVDGYNLPVAIVMLSSNSSLDSIPRNLTNPSCIGTVGNLQNTDFNPYTSGSGTFLGTNSSDPLAFDTTTTLADVAQWCPWNLQVSSSTGPSGGVYIYPDGNLNRPAFDPCYSACSKWNLPADCCTGQYDSASSCSPSQYSKAAKSVCPDAYSYAFDDQTSTFIVPSGPGFEVIFCPGGRSTNIIATSNGALIQLTQNLLYNIDVPVFFGNMASRTGRLNVRIKDVAATIKHSNLTLEQSVASEEQRVPVLEVDSLTNLTEPRAEGILKEPLSQTQLESRSISTETITTTVTASARATLSLPEMFFISQWHGTGLWTNDTTSAGYRTVTNLYVLFIASLAVGFLSWIMW